ncbi:MAG: hypothetical protein KKG47_00050 [Proteobacteria bacterium]|nr:hypothetical protein [Pseudomonadota bacterium]MBU1738486.1 hypothetical protein [Pseudomonadota bacterium]
MPASALPLTLSLSKGASRRELGEGCLDMVCLRNCQGAIGWDFVKIILHYLLFSLFFCLPPSDFHFAYG